MPRGPTNVGGYRLLLFPPMSRYVYAAMHAARTAGLISIAALWLTACGGGSTFAQGVYDDGTVRYRVAVPDPRFQRVEVGDNDLAFFNPELGTIAINSTCSEYEDVPERALMNHLLFGTREQVFRTDEVVTLVGRGALHEVVDLELDGVPLTLEVYLLKKDGCIYDLTRTSSREAFATGRPAFEAFVRGFAVISTRFD